MVPWTLPKPSSEPNPQNYSLFPSPGLALGAPMGPNGIPKGHQNHQKCIRGYLGEPPERVSGKNSEIEPLWDPPRPLKSFKTIGRYSKIAMSPDREKVTKRSPQLHIFCTLWAPVGSKRHPKGFQKCAGQQLRKRVRTKCEET